MRFKDGARHEKEFWEIEPLLRLILCDIDHWASKFKEEVTVTCLLRSAKEQSDLFHAGAAPSVTSVHMYGRGADVRLFKDENLNRLVGVWVNEKYKYDVNRPKLHTLITHEGSAVHHHIQVMDS